jgi:hypothetical protein
MIYLVEALLAIFVVNTYDKMKEERKNGRSPEQRAINRHFLKYAGSLILIFLLISMIGSAFAQTINRTFQNPMGQNIGRSTTDPQGRTTFYDNMGKNTGRAVTNGNTTTFYDNMGRETGRSNAR